MGDIRLPAVAGTFYPRDAHQLRADVRSYLAAARQVSVPPKAIIAPHAGYIYSGPVAASAFATLAPLRGRISRVVLMGPAHRFAFAGLALPRAEAFATPLGVLRVDAAATAILSTLSQVLVSEHAHAGEHSLEVELPFLQELLGDVSLVPLAVGDATDVEAADVLERLWGGPETCIVVSSDLSHYHPYSTAKRLDRATADAIERLTPEEIGEDQACGYVGVRALLRVARAQGLRATTLDLRSSGDTAGPRRSVVGYGAFAMTS